jgi:hypothetical protein
MIASVSLTFIIWDHAPGPRARRSRPATASPARTQIAALARRTISRRVMGIGAGSYSTSMECSNVRQKSWRLWSAASLWIPYRRGAIPDPPKARDVQASRRIPELLSYFALGEHPRKLLGCREVRLSLANANSLKLRPRWPPKMYHVWPVENVPGIGGHLKVYHP